MTNISDAKFIQPCDDERQAEQFYDLLNGALLFAQQFLQHGIKFDLAIGSYMDPDTRKVSWTVEIDTIPNASEETIKAAESQTH